MARHAARLHAALGPGPRRGAHSGAAACTCSNSRCPCIECRAHHLPARLQFIMHSSLMLLLLLLLCSWWICLAAHAMIGWLLTWTAGWRPTAFILGWRRPCKH